MISQAAVEPAAARGAVSSHPRDLLDALAEQLEDGLLVVTADRRIGFANGPAKRLLELPQDSTGKRLVDVNRDYRLALTVASCFDHGSPVSRELSHVKEGRHTVARAFPARVAPESRRVEEVAVLLHDETRMRRLETVRRDFIANVSHELRTPIAAIKLIVDTLQAGALGDVSIAEGFVDRIAVEVTQMAHMVEELLELNIMEAGQTPSVAAVEVQALMSSIDRLRPLAEARRIAIDVDVEEGVPPLLGDSGKLGQALRNLVHNAIKFSPQGERISVQASRLDGREAVEIRVSDHGPGIAAADLPRIFERFWKADRSRQRDGEGSGLGLAIARHIVEGHGGTIRVHSQLGRGATFTVVVPAAA